VRGAGIRADVAGERSGVLHAVRRLPEQGLGARDPESRLHLQGPETRGRARAVASSPCTVDDGRDYYCGGTIYMDAETHLALQASCYSGVYIGADRNYFPVSSEWLDVWGLVIRNTIDDAHDHGKGENHEYWTTAGFDAASPAACDT
jgi:hypothetical protein